MNYGDQTNTTAQLNAMENNKRALSQSKSQENFDLIRGNYYIFPLL